MGTGSLRRRSQLLALRPDLDVLDLRGNVDTRLRRLADGDYDAIVLADGGAGPARPRRRGRARRRRRAAARRRARAAWRSRRARTTSGSREAAAALTDRDALAALLAERAVVGALDAGCHTPMGAMRAGFGDGRLELAAYVGLPDGSQLDPRRARGAGRGARRPRARGGRAPAERGRRRAAGGGGARERWRSVLVVAEGTVYLVGAGPGDPGLLTRRALELIARADAILYDRLIPAGALDGARAGRRPALRGQAARRPGDAARRRSTPCSWSSGRPARTVVRLKGGDPFVFGRGGEEAEALADAGVPLRGRARRDRRRGRARLRRDPRDAPRRGLGRGLRDRPRGSREGRDRARLGGARPLPGHARALHGRGEPRRRRRAAGGRGARPVRARRGGGARNAPGPAHA